jgi:hypothetical protein
VSGNLADQTNWVRRVLGVRLSAPGSAPGQKTGGNDGAPGLQAARQAWQDANDAVNDQINGLRTALLNRAKGGDDGMEGLADALTEIAEKGLSGVTENYRVRLMASLMELGTGDAVAVQKFGAKALGMITTFQTFMADGKASEKMDVCDGNPFGASVSIRATIGPPLQQMAAALQAAGVKA